MAYFHGIQVIEISDLAGGSSSSPGFDFTPPRITSTLAASVNENAAWSLLLTADKVVTFAKRTGADSDRFTLAGATLSLAAQDYEGGQIAFVCNLRATDAAGNASDFAVSVTILDVAETSFLMTSAATGIVDENSAYAVTLVANRTATFAKRAGADSDAFTLTGAGLTLPAKDYEAGKALFTCNLRATDADGATLDFTHAVTIRDVAEPTIAFAVPAVLIAEGNSGTKAVTNTVNLTRNGATGAIVVNLAYAGTATAGTDYAAGPASVTIADGATAASFDILVNGDTTVEADETIIITASLAAYPAALAAKTITIVNDDAASFTVTIDPVARRSGNVLTFTARRSGSVTAAYAGTYAVAGSTSYAPAAVAADFGGAFPSGALNFAAGSATTTFTVTSPVAQPE